MLDSPKGPYSEFEWVEIIEGILIYIEIHGFKILLFNFIAIFY